MVNGDRGIQPPVRCEGDAPLEYGPIEEVLLHLSAQHQSSKEARTTTFTGGGGA